MLFLQFSNIIIYIRVVGKMQDQPFNVLLFLNLGGKAKGPKDVKLDGVGPVDNRPSTDKLHHIVKKKIKKIWHVTHDM